MSLAADGFILGLDAGGTKLAAGVLGRDNTLKVALRRPTPKTAQPQKVLAALAALGRQAMKKAGVRKKDLRAAGLSIAGPLDLERGVALSLPNMPGFEEFPVVAWLSEALDVPVVMENDANAAAMGEYHLGGHTRSQRFVYFTLSTGIGSGFLIDGQLYRGAGGGGTEFGHLNLYPGGHPCGCGARGCFEAHCSGTAIARRAREAWFQHHGKKNSRLSTPAFFQAVQAGEPWATALNEDIAADMGRALGGIVNVLGPDRIVLGGGVANQWGLMQTQAVANMRRHAFPSFCDNVEIFVSTRPDDIALMGAGVVASQSVAGE